MADMRPSTGLSTIFGIFLGLMVTAFIGVGWIVATDTSTGRFAVIAVALAITLGLGYMRFVRWPSAAGALAAAPPHAPVGPDDLESRVRRLEERLDDAARAMQPCDRPSFERSAVPRATFRTTGFDLGPSLVGRLDDVEGVLALVEGDDARVSAAGSRGSR